MRQTPQLSCTLIRGALVDRKEREFWERVSDFLSLGGDKYTEKILEAGDRAIESPWLS